MRAFGYEIRKLPPSDDEMKQIFLDNAEQNAQRGLIQAQLELTHHTILLKEAPDLHRMEEEIKGYQDAIERDKKSINNWNTQLKAIKHERQ